MWNALEIQKMILLRMNTLNRETCFSIEREMPETNLLVAMTVQLLCRWSIVHRYYRKGSICMILKSFCHLIM